ncbi:MAG TPA: GNAT family N-acetyltransferase [Humisphaera sp.]|jgi:predicted acetyltransferase|nr:GNAT family N-acetyltransferase [Humisphaera sp.]
MALSLHWLGEESLDRIADVRLRCFAPSMSHRARYAEIIRDDRRAVSGDYLLAAEDGIDVGTATAQSMAMWVRGGSVPCQGVAWVGTIATHRRRPAAHGGGVASRIMREVIRAARERGQVVSALMPFRASFYEHFGYGLVERRAAWNLALSAMHSDPCDGMQFYQPSDRADLAACRQRIVEAGQCDIERSAGGWEYWHKVRQDEFIVVDRSEPAAIRGYLVYQRVTDQGKEVAKVVEMGFEDPEALVCQLSFLATLRDQFAAASITVPADLPLNWLLREPQIPHRQMNHPCAQVTPQTRMQLRVLDHKRFIEAMHFPADIAAKITIGVRECEGNLSRFTVDVSDGHATVTPFAGDAEFECTDRVWAAIAGGGLSAVDATRLKLAQCEEPVARRLGFLHTTPAPFCEEYF